MHYAIESSECEDRSEDASGPTYMGLLEISKSRYANEINIPRAIFQTKSLRNFFEISSSSSRSPCRLFIMADVRPSILIPFIELSIEAVDEIRLSIASSHTACLATTKDSVIRHPIRATGHGQLADCKAWREEPILPRATPTGTTQATPSSLSSR